MNHQSRLRRLRAKMAQINQSALLLTHAADVRYLSGFTGSNAVLLVMRRTAVLLTDGRYTVQARQETAGARIRVVIGKQLLTLVGSLLHRAGVERVAYDSSQTHVATLARLEAGLPAEFSRIGRRRFFEPLPSSPVDALRRIKDAEELACIEAAALLGCQAFEQILPHLAPGIAERDIAAELEYAARRLGADGMSFDTIVASGPRSALPHGHATAQPLPRRGFVTMDFGVILRGYCSDMTRTVYLGKPTREEKTAYAAVLAAEQAGIAAATIGASAGQVDNAARNVLKRAKLAKWFSHSTGHGVGLEIHEGPRLGAKVEEVLEAGMVVTVEPGVYLPGKFGIRIEDMVVVEQAGPRVLTPTPTELLTL